MKTIQVYDPAMRCSTGICGTGIKLFAWVINQSLLNSGSCDPLLQRREAAEHPYLTEGVERHATRTAWLPWQAEEPVGPAALARLGSSSLEPKPHER
jgi:arsenite-transporting ATPase